MPRQERSAGFVVFRPSLPGPPEFLLLNYGHHWDYPKGHVEKGEDDLTAALRELREETSLEDPRIFPEFRHEIVYFFRDRKHKLIRKAVVFFLGEVGREEIVLSDEHVGYEYLPFEQALARLSYASAKEVLRQAQSYLEGKAATAS